MSVVAPVPDTAVILAGRTPPEGPAEVFALALPLSGADLAELQKAAADRLAEVRLALSTAPCESVAMRETYTEELNATARDIHAIVEMRTGATQVADRAVRSVRVVLRTVLDPLEEAERLLKAELAAFAKRAAAVESSARAEARLALQSDNGAALAEALTVAEAAGAETGGQWIWKVKRVVPELLPDEYWMPDAAKIAAVAKTAGGSDEPPVIPGVVFEREPVIKARRGASK